MTPIYVPTIMQMRAMQLDCYEFRNEDEIYRGKGTYWNSYKETQLLQRYPDRWCNNYEGPDPDGDYKIFLNLLDQGVYLYVPGELFNNRQLYGTSRTL